MGSNTLTADWTKQNRLSISGFFMRQFQELGSLVESRWREQNYNEALFPEIAAHALTELDLTEEMDPWEIIRWVHRTPNLPRQQDRKAKFGNPPITLFVGSRFYVDVYFWLDGTTTVHQHAFSGAFQVLLGSSVHSHYRFEKDREINPYFLTIRQKFPESDPVGLAVGWIKEMAAIRIFGSPEPNVLGIRDFETSHLTLFEALLRGLSVEEIKALAASKSSFPHDSQLPIEDLIERIKALALFKSIFTGKRTTIPSVS